MSLLTNLQSAYTFESSGASLGNDSSGNAFNLTNHGSVPQAAGNASPGTNAASFPASATVYLGGNGAVVNIPAVSDWEVACWCRPAVVAPGYDMFICGLELFPTHQWSLWAGDSSGATKNFKFITNQSGGGGALSGTSIIDGQAAFVANAYYFINAWYDHNLGTIFIDRNNSGSPASVAAGVPFGSGFNGLNIGATPDFGGGFGLNGRVDALHTWTSLRTTGERTSLFNAGLGLEYPFPGGGGSTRRRCSGIVIGCVHEIQDRLDWAKRRLWDVPQLWRPTLWAPATI